MPTVAPIHDAGEVSELFSYDRVWVALGSLRVLAAPEEDAAAHGLLEVQGELAAPVYAGEDVKGELGRAVRSSLDIGAVYHDPGYGLLDMGSYSPIDGALGSMGLADEGLAPAIASIILRNYPSLTGQLLYLAMAGLELRSGFYDPAEGLVSIRGSISRPSRSTLAARYLGDAASGGTLETGTQSGYPALSSLEDGTESGAVSPASVDAQDGEGIDFIVDIQDTILATGVGDV